MSSVSRWLILAIPLALVGGLIFTRIQAKSADEAELKNQQKAKKGAPVSVEIAVAQARPLIEAIEAVGTVNSPYSVGLSPRTSGRITSISVREGDEVKAGQVLARIDPSEANAKVLQNQASLSEARSRLAQAQATVQANEIQIEQAILQARAQLSSAQAALSQTQTSSEGRISDANAAVKTSKAELNSALAKQKNAEAQLKASKVVQANVDTRLKRLKSLLEKGYIAAQQVDDAQAQAATAEANVAVSEGALEAAEAEVAKARAQLEADEARVKTAEAAGKAELKAAQARIDQAKAAVAQAEASRAQTPAYRENINALKAGVSSADAQLSAAGISMSDTELRSSINGSVTERNGDPGSMASPGQPVLKVEFLDWLYVDAALPVTDSNRVRQGLPVTIKIDGLEDEVFSGKVDQVVQSASQQDRQFTVKIRVENPGRRIRPGMFARVSIQINRYEAMVVIPNDAVQDGKVTLLDSSDKASQQEVTLGRKNRADVEVLSGLKAGDRVVVLSYNPVKDGATARVTAERLPDGSRRVIAQEPGPKGGGKKEKK